MMKIKCVARNDFILFCESSKSQYNDFAWTVNVVIYKTEIERNKITIELAQNYKNDIIKSYESVCRRLKMTLVKK